MSHVQALPERKEVYSVDSIGEVDRPSIFKFVAAVCCLTILVPIAVVLFQVA